jgi:hypothetical protein
MMWTSPDDYKETLALLSRWQGATGQAWGYDPRDASLVLRFYRDEKVSPWAFLMCGSCSRVQFDSHWENAELHFAVSSREAGHEFKVTDGSRLYIRCRLITATESVV